jgi:hypothetical protein
MMFVTDEDDCAIEAVMPQSRRGGPAGETCADDDESRRHSHLDHEIALIDVERIELDRLRRWWCEHSSGRYVELRPVAPAGHDSAIQRPFPGERALLMRARVVDREEASIRIGHGDADSLHVEGGKLAGLDICRRADSH